MGLGLNVSKWPESVSYPPPNTIYLWTDKTEFYAPSAKIFIEGLTPEIGLNLTPTPWRLTGIEWIFGKPVTAKYGNVRIPIKE